MGESEQKLKYPRAVLIMYFYTFISSLGASAYSVIQTMLITEYLGFSNKAGKIIFHIFYLPNLCVPFTAMLTDSYVKNWTQMACSYTIARILDFFFLLSLIKPLMRPNPALSLSLRLCGVLAATFGQPCFVPLIGAQFKLPEQANLLSQFFAIQYLIHNSVSVISFGLAPVLKRDIKCFGDNYCYSAVVGIFFGCTTLALFVFFATKRWFVINPPAGNLVMWNCLKLTAHSLKRSKLSSEKREHFLDFGDDEFSKEFIEDTKRLKILILMIPAPLFWCLYSQQESTWVNQAKVMNAEIGSYYRIPPDQMIALNPLICAAIIPLLELYVFPGLQKAKLVTTKLQRMGWALVVMGSSFIVSGIVMLAIERQHSPKANPGESHLRIYNNNDCELKIISDVLSKQPIIVPPLSFHELFIKTTEKTMNASITATCGANTIATTEVSLEDGKEIGYYFKNDNDFVKFDDDVQKLESGYPSVRTLINTKNTLKYIYITKKDVTVVDTDSSDIKRQPVQIDRYDFNLEKKVLSSHDFKVCGVYVQLVKEMEPGVYKSHLAQVVAPNTIHILWMLPQYILAAIGEVVYNITCQEFFFMQAPSTMKAVVYALYMLTITIGNLFIAVFESIIHFKYMSTNLFTFAGLQGVGLLLHCFLARKKYTLNE